MLRTLRLLIHWHYSTSPSVYVVYSSLRATVTCDSSLLETTGPSFEAKTIGYSSSFLAYGTVRNPGPNCDEYYVDDGFHTINFTDLYFSPITTSVYQKPGCPAVVNPRLSLPADLTSVDPAWTSCEPLFDGAFDPPSFLKKASGGLAPPTVSRVPLTSAGPALVPPLSAIPQAIPTPVTPIATEDPNSITATNHQPLANPGVGKLSADTPSQPPQLAQNTSPSAPLNPASVLPTQSDAPVSASTVLPVDWGQNGRPSLPVQSSILQPLETSQPSGPEGTLSLVMSSDVSSPSGNSFQQDKNFEPIFVDSAERTSVDDTEASVPAEPTVHVESHVGKSGSTNSNLLDQMTAMPMGTDTSGENMSHELPDPGKSSKLFITRGSLGVNWGAFPVQSTPLMVGGTTVSKLPEDGLLIASQTIIQSAQVTVAEAIISVSSDNVALGSKLSSEPSQVPYPPLSL